ncbi:hypothetical protein N7532_007824 [Penicillium argentinense]|uniref:Uncharacterized protein n=1 Tax=Penicillium argentinense TaxID=1131581 RepID=A0A9W9EWG4_9EURO|nr:uncharacterized protein N7532_007824 [Penicillium argentinense]KAJ5089140.1 hypothetical protein N7532_007824 [Penicillium argentinense]
MADPPASSSLPSRALRRRGPFPARAATFVEGMSMPDWQRRNSTLSDSISEARNSIRSSTDDLFLPRVAKGRDPIATDESHWHSAPLGLALLPAIAGVFFHDGSAFVTDVTLLVLAAIFLNWSVRLPWDWYRSAQAIQREQGGLQTAAESSPMGMDLKEEDDEAVESPDDSQPPRQHRDSVETQAAKELQIHELAALAACFIFPVIGTWLLHAIRSSLSRPSEGLVSNYNLTVFLLASEVRPFSHLLKLVQARTLHLQHIVASASTSNEECIDHEKVQDLTKRLEELEAHVAEAAAARLSPSKPDPKAEPTDAPTLITQAVVEVRRAVQPDIEALNRAVRRYEKRTTLSALQTDTRFQQLEASTRDAIALAAAAQRSSASHKQSYAFILIDWVCACIVVPARLALSILNLPACAASLCIAAIRRMLDRPHPMKKPRSRPGKGKSVQESNGARFRSQSPQPRAPIMSPLTQPKGTH